MAETEKTAAMLLDDVAALDLPQRREVTKALRKVVLRTPGAGTNFTLLCAGGEC